MIPSQSSISDLRSRQNKEEPHEAHYAMFTHYRDRRLKLSDTLDPGGSVKRVFFFFYASPLLYMSPETLDFLARPNTRFLLSLVSFFSLCWFPQVRSWDLIFFI